MNIQAKRDKLAVFHKIDRDALFSSGHEPKFQFHQPIDSKH